MSAKNPLSAISFALTHYPHKQKDAATIGFAFANIFINQNILDIMYQWKKLPPIHLGALIEFYKRIKKNIDTPRNWNFMFSLMVTNDGLTLFDIITDRKQAIKIIQKILKFHFCS